MTLLPSPRRHQLLPSPTPTTPLRAVLLLAIPLLPPPHLLLLRRLPLPSLQVLQTRRLPVCFPCCSTVLESPNLQRPPPRPPQLQRPPQVSAPVQPLRVLDLGELAVISEIMLSVLYHSPLHNQPVSNLVDTTFVTLPELRWLPFLVLIRKISLIVVMIREVDPIMTAPFEVPLRRASNKSNLLFQLENWQLLCTTMKLLGQTR
mmetsp:Transcript_16086/g.48324  ORF Transcript_16086/g.48324 Transcript_16086/m.48324 type:complete len:204 (+) Transcript_16086:291-902(+)